MLIIGYLKPYNCSQKIEFGIKSPNKTCHKINQPIIVALISLKVVLDWESIKGDLILNITREMIWTCVYINAFLCCLNLAYILYLWILFLSNKKQTLSNTFLLSEYYDFSVGMCTFFLIGMFIHCKETGYFDIKTESPPLILNGVIGKLSTIRYQIDLYICTCIESYFNILNDNCKNTLSKLKYIEWVLLGLAWNVIWSL